MKDKIKKYADEHPADVGMVIGWTSAVVGACIVIIGAKAAGYKMVKPVAYTDEGLLVVRELFGRLWEYNPEK